MRFKKGDIVYDAHYNIVVRMEDPLIGEATLIDEPNEAFKGEIIVYLDECSLATTEQIEAAFNEETTQSERLFNTPSIHLT
jgi:hypothetical protein